MGCAAPIPALALPSLAAPRSESGSCHRTDTSQSFQRRGEPRRDRTRTAIAPRGASPSSPPGNKRAGPGVQTAHGRTAAGQGQPARPAERHGREARPSPEPCGKGLPGAPTSPAALAGREAPDSSRRRSRPSAAASPPAALYRPPYAHPIGHRRAASAQARASIGQKAS